MKKRYTYNRLSGTDIVVSDCARGRVEKLNVKFRSSQVSKNLFNGLPWRKVYIGNGYVQTTSSTATINSSTESSVVYTLTSAYSGAESNFIPVISGVIYTLSFTNSTSNRLYITQYNSNKERVSTLNTNISSVGTTTFTASQDGYVAIAWGSTTIQSNVAVTDIQIEYGSTATTYASYYPTPDYPIPVLSTGDGGSLKLWSHNNNIFDIKDYTYPRYLSKNELIANLNSDNSIQISGTMVTTGYHDISLSPKAKTYLKAGVTYYGKNIVASCIRTIDNSWFANVAIGNGGYTPMEDLYFEAGYWSYYRGTTDRVVNERITPYIGLVPYSEPYKLYCGNTQSIPLPSGYVGGSLPNGVEETEAQKKIGKVVLNGSESGWKSDGNLTTVYRYYLQLADVKLNSENVNNSLVSHFRRIVNYNTDSPHYYITDSGKIYIFSAISTLADFKTWLASNPVTVYYELATPEPISLTTPLIEVYEGATTITTTNNVKPSLTIEAWANRK